jgi:outer membrane receptor for ferric coprogen and ferric-rhodotorulic acid
LCQLGATAASAQTVPAAPAPASDATVTLSPFMVSTDKDVGFVAATSLAGGRLAGELKDTPVAYSVLTREFIDALGLDDLTQAVEWSVGTHQNVDAGATPIFAGNPSFSARGVSGISLQRNFSPTA